VTEALLDSGATGLVISEEFTRKHKFRRTKLERLIYMRNVDCYDSMLKVLSKELTLVLSDTRELDKVPSTK